MDIVIKPTAGFTPEMELDVSLSYIVEGRKIEIERSDVRIEYHGALEREGLRRTFFQCLKL